MVLVGGWGLEYPHKRKGVTRGTPSDNFKICESFGTIIEYFVAENVGKSLCVGNNTDLKNCIFSQWIYPSLGLDLLNAS